VCFPCSRGWFPGAGELFAQLKESVDAVESSASSSEGSHASRFRTRGGSAGGSSNGGSSSWRSSNGVSSSWRSSTDVGRRRGGSEADSAPSLEQRVQTMQRDSDTYCDEPADLEDFEAWEATFALESMSGEVDQILVSNSFMRELQSRIVPLVVEYDAFWTRYFYRLHNLKVEFGVAAASSEPASLPEYSFGEEEAKQTVGGEGGAEVEAVAVAVEEAEEKTGDGSEAVTEVANEEDEATEDVWEDVTSAVEAVAMTLDGKVEEKSTSALVLEQPDPDLEEKPDPAHKGSETESEPECTEPKAAPESERKPELELASEPPQQAEVVEAAIMETAAAAAAVVAAVAQSKARGKGTTGVGKQIDNSEPLQSASAVSSEPTVAWVQDEKTLSLEGTCEQENRKETGDEETPEEMSKSGLSVMSADSAGSDSPKTHRRVTQVTTDEEAMEWTSDDSMGGGVRRLVFKRNAPASTQIFVFQKHRPSGDPQATILI